MSGLNNAMIGHMVKRGLVAAQQMSPEYMASLQQDAAEYENAGPEMELQAWQFLPVIITGIFTILLIASIRYTVGEVMASLAMIESPSSTAIIEPPAYTEEPDMPLEKEPLIEKDADVEITVINHKPITAKITTTMGHLQRIGGWRARWRGLGLSVMYHSVHAFTTQLLASTFSAGLIGQTLIYILVSVGTARLHMLWTHTMISHPSEKPAFRRFVPRKQCKAILLPALVYAVAQQATFLLPVGVAFALNVHEIRQDDVMKTADHDNCAKMVLIALRVLAVPSTAIFVALALLLPAAVTLTRVEATLLPEGEQTIVPFDREAIVGDIDTTVRGGSRALFVAAWRSFDRSARLRVVKLYAKMVLAQCTVAFIGLHLAVAELYVLGGERLAMFVRSGTGRS